MTLPPPLRRGSLLLLIAVLALVVAACSSDGSTRPSAEATVVDGQVAMSADDLTFDVGTIRAPAGEPFIIVFTQNETEPHNVAIYVSDGGAEIVKGDILTTVGATDEIDVPALEPGTYFFKCDVHPEMNGELVVEG